MYARARIHANIPYTHADNPPKRSYYWRWHDSGEGSLSTIEAVYYAAWQVATATAAPATAVNTDDLVDMFWLFGLQREIIRSSYAAREGGSGSGGQEEDQEEENDGKKDAPFTESAKQRNRALRKKQGLLVKEEKKKQQQQQQQREGDPLPRLTKPKEGQPSARGNCDPNESDQGPQISNEGTACTT